MNEVADRPVAPPTQAPAQRGLADPAARDLVTLACAASAAALAGTFAIARWLLPSAAVAEWIDAGDVAAALGLSWLVLALPRLAAGRAGVGWAGAEAAWTLGVLALTAAIGALEPPAPARGALTIGGAAAIAALGRRSLPALRAVRSWRATATVLAAVAAATAWTAGASWCDKYQSPWFLERIAAGLGHIDTLYHTAVASMIDAGLGPSTGLDGAPYVPYHFGSHVLYACWSSLLSMQPVEFYQVGHVVVMVPLAARTFVGFALDLRPRLAGAVGPAGLTPSAVVLACVAWTGAYAVALQPWAHVGSNLVISESYTVATLLLLCGASLVVRATAEPRATLRHSKIWWWVALPALIFALGLTKVSSLALGAAMLGLVWWRHGWYKTKLGWLAAAAWATPALVSLVITKDRPALWGPVPYVRTYVLSGDAALLWPLQLAAFVALHYGWVWAWAAARLAGEPGPWRVRLRRWRLLPPELSFVLVIAILAALPGMALRIAGGSAYYFSDTQRWLAAAFVIAWWPRCEEALRAPGRTHYARLGLWCAMTLLAYQGAQTTFAWQTSWASLAGRGDHTEAHRTLARLVAIGHWPRDDKRDAALWLPRAHARYWGLATEQATPLIAPALTGLPLLDGLPDRDYRAAFYGYAAYPAPSGRHPADVQEAAAWARQRGYARLVVLHPDDRVELVALAGSRPR